MLNDFPDVDLYTLHHMDDESLYDTCQSSRYLYHLCTKDKILRHRIHDYIQFLQASMVFNRARITDNGDDIMFFVINTTTHMDDTVAASFLFQTPIMDNDDLTTYPIQFNGNLEFVVINLNNKEIYDGLKRLIKGLGAIFNVSHMRIEYDKNNLTTIHYDL